MQKAVFHAVNRAEREATNYLYLDLMSSCCGSLLKTKRTYLFSSPVQNDVEQRTRVAVAYMFAQGE